MSCLSLLLSLCLCFYFLWNSVFQMTLISHSFITIPLSTIPSEIKTLSSETTPVTIRWVISPSPHHSPYLCSDGHGDIGLSQLPFANVLRSGVLFNYFILGLFSVTSSSTCISPPCCSHLQSTNSFLPFFTTNWTNFSWLGLPLLQSDTSSPSHLHSAKSLDSILPPCQTNLSFYFGSN